MANGFSGFLGGLPQLLWSNLAGTINVRARKIIVSTNLTLTDNADGTASLSATGGGGGSTTDPQQVMVHYSGGGSLSKGTVIKASGGSTVGGVLVVSAHTESEDPTQYTLIGVLAADIAGGTDGLCTTQGIIDSLDTSGFSFTGNFLYADATGQLQEGTGGLTFKHQVAIVLTIDATTGSILVLPRERSVGQHDHTSISQGGTL